MATLILGQIKTTGVCIITKPILKWNRAALFCLNSSSSMLNLFSVNMSVHAAKNMYFFLWGKKIKIQFKGQRNRVGTKTGRGIFLPSHYTQEIVEWRESSGNWTMQKKKNLMNSMENAPVLCGNLFPSWYASSHHWDLRGFQTNILSTTSVNNRICLLINTTWALLCRCHRSETRVYRSY